MGNLILYEARPEIPYVKMSNGLTQVFIDTLTLAMSSIASTDKEKEFTVFIASRSQPAKGGWGGFDVSEMPWTVKDFDKEKSFLLTAILMAKQKFRWDALSYKPKEEWTVKSLGEFEAIVTAFQREDIAEEASWILEKPAVFTLCEKHLTYNHQEGCIFCDES
jgi:hypothetical protein